MDMIERFKLADGVLALGAAGTEPGDCMPLCVMPPNRAYQIEAEVEVDGQATAGIMLFSSPETYVGLAVSEKGTVQRVRKAFRTFGTRELKVGRRKIELRIVNDRQDVRFYYKDNAGAWQIMQPSMEISGAHHNAIGGWHAIRPALFAAGKGQARFGFFRMSMLKEM